MALQCAGEFLRSELAAAIAMRHAFGDIAAATDYGHLEGIDRQTLPHSRADRVTDDSRRAGVLDCAQVQLSFIGVVLGYVGEPQLIRAIGSELVAGSSVGVDNHAQVVMDGAPGRLPFLTRALPMTENQALAEDSRHAVRTAIDSPVASALSARYRYPNSGSSRWASKSAWARYAWATSASGTGDASNL